MIEVVLFDFDGVLCYDRFYQEMLLPQHQELFDWIQNNIFSNKDLFHQWMRGKVSTKDINKIISESTNQTEEFLNEVLMKSLQKIRLDGKMLNFAKGLRKNFGKKIGIITDNVDVFSTVIAKNHKLDDVFDVITNSADYGCLKIEQRGKLFDEALKTLNKKIGNTFFIDNTVEKVDFFKQKGGQGFLYNNNLEELSNLLRL